MWRQLPECGENDELAFQSPLQDVAEARNDDLAPPALSWRIPPGVVKLEQEESSMPLPPIQVVMEEVTDPQEIAEAQAQMEQA